MLRPLDRGIQCTPNFDRRERSYRGIYVNDGLGWRAFPFGVLSGSAGLGQRSIFRPFVCVGVRRYGWEMPGYRSEAIPDHFVARRHVGMVGICQAVTAWHFATIIKLETARKRSRFAGLQQRGILRPNVWCKWIGNGRKLPGCNEEAFLDRFLVGWDCGRFSVHPTPGSRETAGTRPVSASPASARCVPTETTPSSGPARP